MSFDFTNQYISQSYQRVLQTDGSKVYDGTGSLAILEYSGSFVGDGSGLTGVGGGGMLIGLMVIPISLHLRQYILRLRLNRVVHLRQE